MAQGSSAPQPSATLQSRAAQAQALTQALVTLNARYRETNPLDGAHLLNQLLDLAAERQELLASLIGEAPGEVLKTALPARITRGMPAEVQGFLEQWREVEGELEVFHVDHEDPSQSRYLYFLKTDFGERFSLHFAAEPPGLLSGTPVSASGLLLEGVEAEGSGETDGAIALDSGETSVEILECCNGDSAAADAAMLELQHTFGEQRTVVLVVNFQDKPDEKPWTIAQIRDMVFGTVSDFLLENSFGQTWLSGDALGWYTIAQDSTVCDLFGLRNLAKDAATAAGVDLSTYDRFVYLFPKNGCGGSGTAQVGAFPSNTWIIGSFKLYTFAHELLHNLGLHHSHALDCGDVTIGSSCSAQEYGNTVDVMGYSPTVGHVNAFQKERLGWLNHGASPPIATAGSSGTYTIEPYETESANPKALKVLQSEDPTTGQRTWYYLEYRQPLGFDAQIPTTGPAIAENVFNGAVVSLGTESDGRSSFLLDMTPGSEFVDMKDAALTAGQSYSDPEAGVTITTDWADAAGATVSVSFGPATCARANPQVSLSPSESLWVDPGTPVTYTVSVTNKDSPACTNARFDLLVAVPNGWLATFAGGSLTLAPGASGSTTLEVTSPVSAADGLYDITVTAENAKDPAFTASATATYVVSAAVNQPPVAVDDAETTRENTPATIRVLDNDWDPDGDPLSVSAVGQGGKGTVTINPDGTVTYKPNPKAKGQDSFGYTIKDSAGNAASATVSVKITKDGGGGGGKGVGKRSK